MTHASRSSASTNADGSSMNRLRNLLPGLVFALVVAIAATYLGDGYNVPVMLMALLLGMVMYPVVGEGRATPGIQFAASGLLRIGVALLGLRITAGQIAALGWQMGLVIVIGVCAAIGLGFAFARLLKLTGSFGIISGGATAICGASAALAISSVMPKGKSLEAETVLTVALVTSLSTLAMILYPFLSALMGLDDHQAGILFGATIHDVAQVVGAGYAVSEEAGDTATIIKLFRVVLLVPVILMIGLAVGRHAGSPRGLPLPAFAIAFVALVMLNSLVVLPRAIIVPLDALSRWCLVTAVAALGMRTSLQSLVLVGPRPLISVLLTTLALLGFIVLALVLGFV